MSIVKRSPLMGLKKFSDNKTPVAISPSANKKSLEERKNKFANYRKIADARRKKANDEKLAKQEKARRILDNIKSKTALEKTATKKKVGDAAIELTEEGLRDIIKGAVKDILVEFGVIATEEKTDETTKVETEIEIDGEEIETTDIDFEEETEEVEEVEEVEEKVEDAAGDELGKILADPSKKEALAKLLKDTKSTGKKVEDAASVFVNRYETNVSKANDESTVKRPNRYE